MSIRTAYENLIQKWAKNLEINLRRLRWLAIPGVFVLAFFHHLFVRFVSTALPESWGQVAEIIVYGLTGSLVAILGLSWISRAVSQRAEAQTQLKNAYSTLEQRHHQLLNLNALGKQVATVENHQDLFELAARAPMELTDAQASTVVSFDRQNERLNLDMAWGLSDKYVAALRNRISQGIDSYRCQTCKILHAEVGGNCPLFDGLQNLAQEEGIESLVCLPINIEEERASVITAYFPSLEGPPQEHIRLLNILSAVITSALENLKLRATQAETLSSLDDTLSRGPFAGQTSTDIEYLARQVLKIAISGWEAQAGGLFIYDQDNQTPVWVCQAQTGLSENQDNAAFKLAMRMIQQSQLSQRPTIETDLENNPEHEFHSAAAAPLIAEGQVIGALFLATRQRNAISSRHIELLSAVAQQISLAIRNAQLYNQLGQMAVLEERQRLSREFHDGLAQTLGYLNLEAQQIEALIDDRETTLASREMRNLRKHIRAAYVDVREAIDGLRLRLDDPGQLSRRLEQYVADFSRSTGIETSFTANPKNLSTEAEIALQLLRIAQESLTNIRKHAQASHASIELCESLGMIELMISDDGVGFPASESSQREQRSHGLIMMRERAEGIGGTLSVATHPDQGTRINITVPLEEPHD